MPRIEPLIEKLRIEAKKERDMLGGKEPREHFVEAMTDGDIEALLELYTPDIHNTLWDAARQKRPVDLDETMNNRKAIDFMISGKRGVYRAYKETELGIRVAERHRRYAEEYMLKKTLDFVTMKRKQGD